MPEMLSPQQAAQTTVALPGPAAVPVPARQPQPQPQAPAPPPDPFRRKPGPPILILPHAGDVGDGAGGQPQPVRQSRAGRPVRMSEDDYLTTAQQLHAAVAAKPLDRAAWAALSDLLTESGKPWLGHAVQMIGNANIRDGNRLVNYRPGSDTSTQFTVQAHSAGLPWKLFVYKDGGSAMSLHRDMVHRDSSLGLTHLTPGETAGLAHEADGAWMQPDLAHHASQNDLNLKHLQKEASGPAAHLARAGKPVRFHSPDDHRAVQAAIKEGGDDNAPPLVWADMIEEDGHPHLARAIREGAVEETPSLFGLQGRLPVDVFGRHKGIPDANVHIAFAKPDGGPLTAHVSAGSMKYGIFDSQTTDQAHMAGLLREIEPNPADKSADGPWGQAAHRAAAELLRRQSANLARPGRPTRLRRAVRLASAQAPAGGMVVRGIHYPGGEMLPAEATQASPPPTGPVPPPVPSPVTQPPRQRGRLGEKIRRRAKFARHLDPDILRGLAGGGDGDIAPWLVAADHFKEQGLHHLAEAIMHGQRKTSENWWSEPGHGDPDTVGNQGWTGGIDHQNEPGIYHEIFFSPKGKVGRLSLSAYNGETKSAGGVPTLHLQLHDPDLVHGVVHDLMEARPDRKGETKYGKRLDHYLYHQILASVEQAGGDRTNLRL